MRVGLVLGAGGVMGGAWLTGGLEAIARETRWDPASAEYIVGTSAGAVMGSLLAGGVPPWFMVAHSAGEVFEGLEDVTGRPAASADRSGGAVFRPQRGALPVAPGSPRMIISALTRLNDHSASMALCGLLPRGVISNDPIKDTVRRVVPKGWVDHPNVWAVACDYSNGRRVPFGRHDAPKADIADAVAASCAIPGFYTPVKIGGRSYVDGGLWSTSNLDLLAEAELDLVICLNPTSSLHPPRAWNPIARVGGVFRSLSGRRLGSEAKKLRAAGTEVVLIQPLEEDHDAMGANLMATRRRNRVIETAIETVTRQLQDPDNAVHLEDLPEGEPHRIERPPGAPETWPETIARPAPTPKPRRGQSHPRPETPPRTRQARRLRKTG